MTAVADTEYSFALCLTHDVDRPFKTPFHSVYYALKERDIHHLGTLASGTNAYWQFEDIMELESELGVRSAFYFLNERPLVARSPSKLLDLDALVQAFGRYDVRDPRIADLIARLDDGGWEVGLHGSYNTARDRERLLEEKRRIEAVLGSGISGGRQHYLNLSVPDTWCHYRDIGLSYDASLGSSTEYGFQYGYDVRRPFDDDFVVFPLTLMEQQLPDPAENAGATWAVCESLVETAAEHDAVMTVLFHPRYFNGDEFPGYREVYDRLIRQSLARNAWVGPPGEYYETFLADGDRSASAALDCDGTSSASASTR